jgi:hypothetical protein
MIEKDERDNGPLKRALWVHLSALKVCLEGLGVYDQVLVDP